MRISSGFDAGNIIVKSIDSADNIELEIRIDNESHFYQWFHFRLTGATGVGCTMRITNAGDSAYVAGWENYRAVASYDRSEWFRVDTDYKDGVLTISHAPEEDAVYYAYFAPYSMERHADLLAEAITSPLVTLTALGQTLDGQDMDLLEIAEGQGERLSVWFIARQHPGETMAEWWMEGFLERLLDQDDPVAKALLKRCRFHVVPNMNPDGSRRGHLRTNAAGKNLNREWNDPSMEASPEVYLVRQAMHERGVDFHMDVHGDEALPYNFIAGFEGIQDVDKRLLKLCGDFKEALKRHSPDFQTEHGYPLDEPNSADLRKCTDYTAHTFQCLAMTLEMPFKDNANMPDQRYGWSPERCRHLGRAVLASLADVVEDLRA